MVFNNLVTIDFEAPIPKKWYFEERRLPGEFPVWRRGGYQIFFHPKSNYGELYAVVRNEKGGGVHFWETEKRECVLVCFNKDGILKVCRRAMIPMGILQKHEHNWRNVSAGTYAFLAGFLEPILIDMGYLTQGGLK